MVQALERVRPDSSQPVIRDSVELLKHATAECPNLGDAWYYRSMLERKLGNARLADYSLEKAAQVRSEAMQQQLDPFKLAAPPSTLPLGPVRQKWALVVGIGQFKDPYLHKHPLTYTKGDAKAFASLLTNPKVGRFNPANVQVLTDSQATTRAIKEDLNWLARKAGPDDLVVIYISTHGTSREMDTRDVNYLVTYDTEVVSPSPGHDDPDELHYQDRLYASALPMVDVANEVANRLSARRVAIILDTCFSGAAVAGSQRTAPGLISSSVSSVTIDRMRQGTGRVVLAASQGEQESLEDSGLAHGYFTYYLMQGLQQNQGMDSVAKMFPYVQEQVSGRAHAHSHEQTPVMSGSDQGEQIVLGVAAVESAAAAAGP
jgi:Caspase domain